MIEIENKAYKPDMDELAEYIGSPLFETFLTRMEDEFCPLRSTDYSGDTWLRGWNVKFRKAGRALCTLYPKHGYFTVLVVIGRREKQQVEELMPRMSAELREVYERSQEGMGQRWLMIDLRYEGALYEDVLTLMRVRRQSKPLSEAGQA